MKNNGVFITLYDEETLKLYLSRGLYGFLMSPVYDKVSSHSNHYKALSDYGCLREGTHVFFFIKRKVIYGGQIIGNNHDGAFYINGGYSPLGREINAKLCWDESIREKYIRTDEKGVFEVETKGKRCQPYIIKFIDKIDMIGRTILSDELYFELGKYPYPLPSNAIQNMGFCILTPGETNIAIELLRSSSNEVEINSVEDVILSDGLVIFDKSMGVQEIQTQDIVSESHLEFSLLSNYNLLSKLVELPQNYVLSRQVPISPFKPSQMDRADICIYDINSEINNGTLPNIIIELKKDVANYKAIEQVDRYLKWLELIISDKEVFLEIKAYIIAPKFTKNIAQGMEKSKYKDNIKLISYMK